MGMKLLGGRRVRWLTVLPVVAVLGCLVLSINVYRSWTVCVPESRTALTEFPAFEDADIDPGPNFAGSEEDCDASFSTTAPKDHVIGYYREQLSAHGWDVNHAVADENSDLIGTRGNLCYYVSGNEPVHISVKRTDSGTKMSPVGQC